jgi:uncharacterized membrane protein
VAELRGLAAILLVAVLPGLVLTAGLFRGVRLRLADRLAIALGLGVAVAILVGVALAAAAMPLDATSWLVALGIAALAGFGLWFWPGRAEGSPRATAVAASTASEDLARRWTRSSSLRLAGFALAIALAGSGLVIAGEAAADQPYPPYTAFWVVPDGGRLAVGIRSAETGPQTYRIVIRAGDTTLAEWPSVPLAPGEQWTGDAAVPTTSTGGLEADLYRAGDTTPYRHLAWPSTALASP